MDLSFKHQPLPVCQQVTLSTLDLLAAVVAAFFPAHPGRSDQLAGDYVSERAIAGERENQTPTRCVAAW
jgi:hypothetical protein